jgi:hypothetical protein
LVWQTAVAHANSDVIDPAGTWQTCRNNKNARWIDVLLWLFMAKKDGPEGVSLRVDK